MYNHNKAQQSKNRVHISWDILYVLDIWNQHKPAICVGYMNNYSPNLNHGMEMRPNGFLKQKANSCIYINICVRCMTVCVCLFWNHPVDEWINVNC